jgi:GntR family transcriptional regulator, transcriptional repressor for pyruvate dehydrogenase complex
VQPLKNEANAPQDRRISLANEVANKIAGSIQSGEFQTGARIPSEFELAEKYNVGRGTVREAVKSLVSRNVLKIVPAKGTFVCDNPGLMVDPLGLEFVQDKVSMIKDMLEIRRLLECYAARTAALRSTPEQIAHLYDVQKEMDSCLDDTRKCIECDLHFHQCMVEICGNSLMSLVMPIINSNLFHFNNMLFDRDWVEVNEGHHAIVAAIELHDPILAEAEVIRHLSYMTKKLSTAK